MRDVTFTPKFWADLRRATENARVLYENDAPVVEWCDLALWDCEMSEVNDEH